MTRRFRCGRSGSWSSSRVLCDLASWSSTARFFSICSTKAARSRSIRPAYHRWRENQETKVNEQTIRNPPSAYATK